jgi:DNA-directed RNA polymerase specialized sigma24 family protein
MTPPTRGCDVNEQDLLAERFEAHRTYLHSVAYRMLGSTGEATMRSRRHGCA